VAVARKLAVVMLVLLQNQKEYCPLMGDVSMA
jgi:hypothetical protein